MAMLLDASLWQSFARNNFDMRLNNLTGAGAARGDLCATATAVISHVASECVVYSVETQRDRRKQLRAARISVFAGSRGVAITLVDSRAVHLAEVLNLLAQYQPLTALSSTKHVSFALSVAWDLKG